MEDHSGADLGCSKCRYSQRGCKRCKNPTFRAKQQSRTQAANGSRQSRKRQRCGAPIQKQTGPSSHLHLPKDLQDNVAAEAEHLQPSPPEHLQPSPPEMDIAPESPTQGCHSATLPDQHSEFKALQDRGEGGAETATSLDQATDRSKPQHAPAPPPAHPESQEPQDALSTKEEDQPRVPPSPAKAQLPEAKTQGPSSQSTASESRPSFLSMLQSKMETQRQKRRESQSVSQSDGSLSDSSLSSVQQQMGTPGKHPQASPSGNTGTLAPEALAAPRHKVALQKRSAKRSSVKKASKTRAFAQPGQDPRKALWHPPPSPYGLIEEYLYEDPWKLLVACMLLNVTAGKQVRKVLWKLFEIWPTAAIAAAALPDTLAAVESLIKPLGLFRKRTLAIKRFSAEYLETQWVDPIQLHGIGQYASDAYFIFCRGLWREVTPTDKDLLKYQQWLHSTDGEGTGLERDVMPPPPAEGEGATPGAEC